jgi:hypothetical protein
MNNFINNLIVFLLFYSFNIQGQTQIGADIDGEAAGDRSGYSVWMPDASTLAIGAWNNAGTASSAGHVRIYDWNGNQWIQRGSDINGEAAGDYSGYSVSMPDSNTVAIGAVRNDGNGADAGHVRIYDWNGSQWIQRGADIDGEAAGDWCGVSVSMPNNNVVAIGASRNGGTASHAGHVRIFLWNGSTWYQENSDINGQALNDRFGFSVSMPDGGTIAIGAYLNDGNGSNAGHVRIYEHIGLSWSQKGLDLNGESAGDNFGYSVSMPDANTVAIGGMSNGNFSGHVRIFKWNGSAWIQKGIDIDGEAVGDQSGWSVSMPDSNTVAIGAKNNSPSGHVRIYEWNGSAWIQKGADIDGEASSDESGNSVFMPNSNIVAIGAHLNDGNGSNSGHVRIYSFTPLNIIENNFSDKFMVYPNPTKGQFALEFDQIQEELTLRLLSISGQLISVQQYQSSKLIEFSITQPDGMYLLEITNSSEQKAVVKIVKE